MQQIQIHPYSEGLYVFFDMAHGVHVSEPMPLEEIQKSLSELEKFYNKLAATPKIIT